MHKKSKFLPQICPEKEPNIIESNFWYIPIKKLQLETSEDLIKDYGKHLNVSNGCSCLDIVWFLPLRSVKRAEQRKWVSNCRGNNFTGISTSCRGHGHVLAINKQ